MNYDQFIYWRGRSRKKECAAVSKCVPVRVQAAVERSEVICSLVLREGRRLEFHDAVFVREFLQERL
ncbi:MAG: hypothetical protein EBQ92_01480 [Proteobacteria bacterium]|nr:hypothetical protein [Pseudomonadota bacterium]